MLIFSQNSPWRVLGEGSIAALLDNSQCDNYQSLPYRISELENISYGIRLFFQTPIFNMFETKLTRTLIKGGVAKCLYILNYSHHMGKFQARTLFEWSYFYVLFIVLSTCHGIFILQCFLILRDLLKSFLLCIQKGHWLMYRASGSFIHTCDRWSSTNAGAHNTSPALGQH